MDERAGFDCVGFIVNRDMFCRFLCGSIVVICACFSSYAQTPSAPSPTPTTPPSSDIVIVEIKKHHDFKTHADELSFGAPKRITDFVGYNNQPYFMADGRSVLYTSNRNKQTDIYRYDVASGKTTQVTDTSESEYSPTLMPDGKNISVV